MKVRDLKAIIDRLHDEDEPQPNTGRMSMGKFTGTPGPWIVTRGGSVVGGPLVEYVSGKAMAQVAMVCLHETIPDETRDAIRAGQAASTKCSRAAQ